MQCFVETGWEDASRGKTDLRDFGTAARQRPHTAMSYTSISRVTPQFAPNKGVYRPRPASSESIRRSPSLPSKSGHSRSVLPLGSGPRHLVQDSRPFSSIIPSVHTTGATEDLVKQKRGSSRPGSSAASTSDVYVRSYLLPSRVVFLGARDMHGRESKGEMDLSRIRLDQGTEKVTWQQVGSRAPLFQPVKTTNGNGNQHRPESHSWVLASPHFLQGEECTDSNVMRDFFQLTERSAASNMQRWMSKKQSASDMVVAQNRQKSISVVSGLGGKAHPSLSLAKNLGENHFSDKIRNTDSHKERMRAEAVDVSETVIRANEATDDGSAPEEVGRICSLEGLAGEVLYGRQVPDASDTDFAEGACHKCQASHFKRPGSTRIRQNGKGIVCVHESKSSMAGEGMDSGRLSSNLHRGAHRNFDGRRAAAKGHNGVQSLHNVTGGVQAWSVKHTSQWVLDDQCVPKAEEIQGGRVHVDTAVGPERKHSQQQWNTRAGRHRLFEESLDAKHGRSGTWVSGSRRTVFLCAGMPLQIFSSFVFPQAGHFHNSERTIHCINLWVDREERP